MPQPALLKDQDVPCAFAWVLFSDTKYARCWTEVHNWSHEGRKFKKSRNQLRMFFFVEIYHLSPLLVAGEGRKAIVGLTYGDMKQQIKNLLRYWETLFFNSQLRTMKFYLLALALFISSHHTLLSNICKNFEAILLQIHI